MSASEIAVVLGVSRRTAIRYRKHKDWPAVETKASVIAWAEDLGMWDPVMEAVAGKLSGNKSSGLCRNRLHPWTDETIYTAPSTGHQYCHPCRLARARLQALTLAAKTGGDRGGGDDVTTT